MAVPHTVTLGFLEAWQSQGNKTSIRGSGTARRGGRVERSKCFRRKGGSCKASDDLAQGVPEHHHNTTLCKSLRPVQLQGEGEFNPTTQ